MEETKKKRFHYAWVVCIGMTIMQFGVMCCVNGVASLFALPMSDALGITRSEWMLWMTCYSIAAAITSPIIGKLYNSEKINIKILMTGFAIMEICCELLFAFCVNRWMAYLAGALAGISIYGLFTNAIPIIATNWFSGKSRGTATGIMNCGDGIGGIWISPVVQMIIAAAGVQMGYFACAGMTAIFTLPIIWLIIVKKPEDKGLEPCGLTAADEKSGDALAEDANANLGVSTNRAFRSFAFWACGFAAVALGIMAGFKNNVTGMCVEFLEPTELAMEAAMISAYMLSVISFSQLLANIVSGVMIDKLGIVISGMTFAIISVCMFVFWIAMPTVVPALYAGALCYGFHTAIQRTILPMTVRQIFGNKNFASIWGRVMSFKGIIGGFSGTIVALFYDVAGSYSNALWFGFALAMITLVLLAYAFITAKKNPFHWDKPAVAAEA